MDAPTQKPADHPRVAAVKEALRSAGADPASIAGLVLLPEAVTTAAAAAAALDVEVGQIANSLVFDADSAPLLVLTSGRHRVDTGRVAGLVGARSVGRADRELVLAATGQVIGGVAPVGHPAPVRTLVDVALDDYDRVWAAGGVARSVFPTTFTELLAVTGGEAAQVAREA